MSLHDYLPILAFMASNKENKELVQHLTGFIYRRQKENIDFLPKLSIDYDKTGSEIYKNLEESIQKEADNSRRLNWQRMATTCYARGLKKAKPMSRKDKPPTVQQRRFAYRNSRVPKEEYR